MLRPLLEYCAAIFHPMLTKEMSMNLERQQKRAMKIIVGFDKSYDDILEENSIETLEERREKTCIEFAKSLVQSGRFGNLFTENLCTEDTATTRNRKKFTERFFQSQRLYNSPLYTMTRTLNNL